MFESYERFGRWDRIWEIARAQWTKEQQKTLGDTMFIPNLRSLICFSGADVRRVRKCYNTERGIKPFVSMHFPTAARAYIRTKSWLRAHALFLASGIAKDE